MNAVASSSHADFTCKRCHIQPSQVMIWCAAVTKQVPLHLQNAACVLFTFLNFFKPFFLYSESFCCSFFFFLFSPASFFSSFVLLKYTTRFSLFFSLQVGSCKPDFCCLSFNFCKTCQVLSSLCLEQHVLVSGAARSLEMLAYYSESFTQDHSRISTVADLSGQISRSRRHHPKGCKN